MSIALQYHAHLYFEIEYLTLAESINSRLREEWGHLLRVSTLREKPVGPHPLPSFEVIFAQEDLELVRNWFAENRKNFSILIHPVMENDVAGHRDFGEWQGEILSLDYSVLKGE